MYRTINVAATFFVLAALAFAIVATDSNSWIIEDGVNYGLFEYCFNGTCLFHEVPLLTNITIAFICISIFTWCGAFVGSFLKFFKENKTMRFVILVFSVISWCLNLAGCIAYTAEYSSRIQTTTAYWGHSFIIAWCSTGAGFFAIVFNIIIFRMPIVEKSVKDSKTPNVKSVTENLQPPKEKVHMEKLKPSTDMKDTKAKETSIAISTAL